MEILFIFVTPYFPWADAISSSVVNANSLLLITPLEMLSFSCRYAQHLVLWKVFIFNVFCLSPIVYLDKLPFLVFLTVYGLALVDITFSIRKGENLARHTSSKDSITMNLGKSAASFSESDSERFRFVFCLKTPYMLYIFHWPCAPPPTTESNLCWEWTKGVTHSPWLRRGIRDQYTLVEGRLPSRCQFLSTGQIPILNTIDPLPPPSSNLQIRVGNLPLCRGAVCVFYSPSRQGNRERKRVGYYEYNKKTLKNSCPWVSRWRSFNKLQHEWDWDFLSSILFLRHYKVQI